MCRLGCPEEAIQQSGGGAGCVADDEPLVLAFIPPRTNPPIEGSLGSIPGKDWKDKQLSVFRARLGSYSNFDQHVVSARRSAFVGYGWASAYDLRSISAIDLKTGEDTGIGVACIIDDSLPHMPAHARMGESKPKPDFWNKHDRATARANIVRTFRKNGLHTHEIAGLFAVE